MNTYGDSVCRVCLGNDFGLMRCLSLFESYEDSSTLISEVITSIASIRISEGDGLPGRICPECFWQLGTAITFKRKCEVSDKVLRCVQLSQIPIEYKNENKTEISVKEEIQAEVNNDSDNFCSENFDDQVITENQIKPLINKSKSIDLKLICDDCQGSFKSKCKLRVHWKKVHLPEKLICPTCKRMFKSYKAFNKHLKQKTSNCKKATLVHIEGLGKSRVFHCKHCSYKCRRMDFMKTHLLTHTGEKPLQCNLCHQRFTQFSSLSSHKERIHKEYKVEITCHICGKNVKGRDCVYRHLLTHEPPKYKCDICSKVLKYKESLIEHMRRHSGVKTFTCEVCAAKFYTLSELINHRKINHLKNACKYECDKCEFKTSKKYAFVTHKSKHTGTNMPCLTCGYFFEDSQKLENHRKLHAENKFVCPYCGNKYATNKSRGEHVRNKHRNKKVVELAMMTSNIAKELEVN